MTPPARKHDMEYSWSAIESATEFRLDQFHARVSTRFVTLVHRVGVRVLLRSSYSINYGSD